MARAHNFTDKQRTFMAKRAEGKCEKCHAFLKKGEGEADHIIPVELYGESDVKNGQWLCAVCHRGKTNLDIKLIRRAQRRERLDLDVKEQSKFRKPPAGTRYEQGPFGLRPVRGDAR